MIYESDSPDWAHDLVGVNLNQNASYFEVNGRSQAWIAIHVTNIDAQTNAGTILTGVKVFTATCRGFYEGL